MTTEGFWYEGIWIINPHYEETGRFKFDTERDSAIYYGFPEGHHELWQKAEVAMKDYDLGFAIAQHLYQRYLNNEITHEDVVCPAHVSDEFENGFSDCLSQESQMITDQFLGSRESCEDTDSWDDFNKALAEDDEYRLP